MHNQLYKHVQIFLSDHCILLWKALNQLKNSQYSDLRAIIRETNFLQYLLSGYSLFVYNSCRHLPVSAGCFTFTFNRFPFQQSTSAWMVLFLIFKLRNISIWFCLRAFTVAFFIRMFFLLTSLGYFLQPQFKCQLLREVSSNKTG